MVKKPRVLVLRTAGTNCDVETAHAFQRFGARADMVHINQLFAEKIKMKDYHILAVPGGFTYGDDIESGRILANELCLHLGVQLAQFIRDGKLVIGICNGFQVLVKSGVLPGPTTMVEKVAQDSTQKATLTFNDSGKFEDRWTFLRVSGKSVWTQNLPEVVYYPVAHAEGKFVPNNKSLLSRLEGNGQVAFRYCTRHGGVPKYPLNPNGSSDDIAGITDHTGRILGMMPHPERHFFFYNHPQWTRMRQHQEYGDGAQIFKNGVEFVKSNL